MDVGGGDVCDTGLVLGLAGGHQAAKKGTIKLDTSSFHSSVSLEPSLTLGLSDEAYGPVKITKSSTSHSTVSSHSNIKRERDADGSGGGEEVEVEVEERVLSRISDEDEDGSGRKKLRLTKEQSALLEDRFKEHSTLNPKQKLALAKQLNLRPRQVEVWFQNRRARTKLKQTEVDCQLLKRCCEMLKEENRRLQKELQDINSIKFAAAPPVFMQVPAAAATITICPSCERIGGAPGNSKAAGTGAGGTATFVVAQKPRFYIHSPTHNQHHVEKRAL